ncbi:hypothetical protein ECZU41_08230 [Escherichia coli]|nr:hypothetical protein ExPECSC054_3386 [Escherichia coli]BDG94494.1 hypothetical protein TUM13867_24060 [Escherichia coli]BDG99926.1 hypothetical protein TUM20902_30400 [Escherichia coli]BDO64988.1 hypothetical protein TUM2330_14290 [Escherichia coli]BEA81581.1 hypothetical protein VEE04_13380 [Escherichia coli]
MPESLFGHLLLLILIYRGAPDGGKNEENKFNHDDSFGAGTWNDYRRSAQ